MIETPAADELLAHRDFVHRLARRLVGDQRADDLSQDVLVAALERPPRGVRRLRSWLGSVVRNRARMARRADERRLGRERATPPPESAPSPAEAVARLEEQRRVVSLVLDLEEPYRSTVVLRFLEEREVREIAETMEVPVATVHTRLRRALARIRAELDRRHRGDRRAWAALLLPVAPLPRTGGLELTGALLMKPVHLVAAVLVLVVVAAGVAVVAGDLLSRPPEERAAGRSEAAVRDSGTVEPTAAPSGEDPGASDVVATPTPARPPGAEEYLRKINEAGSWRAASVTALEIAKLPPARGRDIMLAIYARIEDDVKRRQILREFTPAPGSPRWMGKPRTSLTLPAPGLGGHLHALDILDVAMRDPSPLVVDRAVEALTGYAFRTFDAKSYAAWRERTKGRPLAQVYAEAVGALADRLRAAGNEEMNELLARHRPDPAIARTADLDLGEAIRASGMADLLADRLREAQASAPAERSAWAWLKEACLDEARALAILKPIVDRPGEHARGAVEGAIGCLATARGDWVDGKIVELLEDPDLDAGVMIAASTALFERASPDTLVLLAAARDRADGGRRPWLKRCLERLLRDAWTDVAGPDLAKRTRLASFQGDRVEVEVDSEALLRELRGPRGEKLLARLRERIPRPHVAELHFRLGVSGNRDR
jgi:RNA polymerase sigma factor (sigma-70 family)